MTFPLCVSQLCHLDLGTSEKVRFPVFWVWAGCMSGMKQSCKAACWSLQTCSFVWVAEAYWLCVFVNSGSTKCSWVLECSVQWQAQCWFWFYSVKHSPCWTSSFWEDPVFACFKLTKVSATTVLLNQFQLIEDGKHYESKAVACSCSCRASPCPAKLQATFVLAAFVKVCSHCFQDDNIMRSLQLFENVM